MIILDEPAVHDLLKMEDLIPAMAAAMADLSAGKVVQPPRVMMPIADHQAFLGLMPAYSSALGAKLVAFYPNNQGIPSHHAMILLFRPETGEPLATMDGRLITEMRTAAVSAVATKLLARPEASVLGILGSGVQARSHLEALRLVRAFRDVRVWSPRSAAAFAKQFGVRATASAEEAVRGADVVVVATTSQTPVLHGAWLAPGTHINAVGAPRPTWRELDDDVMAHTLVVDSREAVLKESGDVILSKAKIFAEAGEIFAGTKKAPAGTTVFKSVGIAAEDIAAARLVHAAAGREA